MEYEEENGIRKFVVDTSNHQSFMVAECIFSAFKIGDLLTEDSLYNSIKFRSNNEEGNRNGVRVCLDSMKRNFNVKKVKESPATYQITDLDKVLRLEKSKTEGKISISKKYFESIDKTKEEKSSPQEIVDRAKILTFKNDYALFPEAATEQQLEKTTADKHSDFSEYMFENLVKNMTDKQMDFAFNALYKEKSNRLEQLREVIDFVGTD